MSFNFLLIIEFIRYSHPNQVTRDSSKPISSREKKKGKEDSVKLIRAVTRKSRRTTVTVDLPRCNFFSAVPSVVICHLHQPPFSLSPDCNWSKLASVVYSFGRSGSSVPHLQLDFYLFNYIFIDF